MKPVDSFIIQLLPEITSSKINLFSCGHVVDVKKQLLPICLGKGPSGKELDYRFASRSTDEMIFETKRILQNWSRVIPAGIEPVLKVNWVMMYEIYCVKNLKN